MRHDPYKHIYSSFYALLVVLFSRHENEAGYFITKFKLFLHKKKEEESQTQHA